MEIYRRLAKCTEPSQIEQLAADLADAYGKTPPMAQTLLDLAEIRVRAAGLGIDSIIRMDPDLIFSVSGMQACQEVFRDAVGSVRLPDDRTIHWRPPKRYLDPPTLITVLLRRLRRADPSL